MVKAEDFNHEETHPRFDGQYCTFESEGYGRKLETE